MKKIGLVFVLLLSAISLTVVNAQDSELELETVEINQFGVEALVPVGWQNAAPGVFARGASAADFTTVIIQSAALPSDTLLSALTGQLGIEEFPESESEQETDFATWTIYLVELEAPVAIHVSVAVAELDGTTYLVLLQSSPDEHETLREAVFMPVLDSIALISDDDNEEGQIAIDVPYTIEEITFENGDITLAGTLTMPEGEGEFPVVLLVSGSGAQDRDESLAPLAEIRPFFDIADYLTRNGIAVLRYDDRGFGESEGDFASADMNDFRDDANAAVDYLASREQFSHIGIAGHSEGGAYAPEIGVTNDNVDFVIGLAGPTVRVIDITREQNQLLFAEAGFDADQLAAVDAAYVAVIEAVEAGDDEALRDAVAALVLAQSGEAVDEVSLDAFVAQFQSPIIQSYVNYNPTPFWLELDVPTLAIFGSLDLQVSAEQSIAVIDGMNDNITIVTIDNMNHIFQEAETGSVAEYGTLEQNVMPELLETLTEWILEVTAQ